MVFSNKGWIDSSLAVCPNEGYGDDWMCVFPSSQEKLESKVGAEGGGRSQQAEPGEYDQEAHTLKT